MNLYPSTAYAGIRPIQPPRFAQSIALPAFSIRNKTITVIENSASRQITDPEEAAKYIVPTFYWQWSTPKESYHLPYYDAQNRELIAENGGITVKIPVTEAEAGLDWERIISLAFEEDFTPTWDTSNQDFDFRRILGY
jgi:hypothetical protein